jgi:hypothetical protein
VPDVGPVAEHFQSGPVCDRTNILHSDAQPSYGDNYTRVSAIKKKYEPANLFRVNQNIKPAA